MHTHTGTLHTHVHTRIHTQTYIIHTYTDAYTHTHTMDRWISPHHENSWETWMLTGIAWTKLKDVLNISRENPLFCLDFFQSSAQQIYRKSSCNVFLLFSPHEEAHHTSEVNVLTCRRSTATPLHCQMITAARKTSIVGFYINNST